MILPVKSWEFLASLESADFSIGTDSPVSCDSLTDKSLLERILMSAGTTSPPRRITASLGTSSSTLIMTCLLSRITRTSCLIRSERRSTAFSERNSWEKLSRAFRTTMVKITMASVCSPRENESTAAPTRMRLSMSRNCPRRDFRALNFSLAKAFSPYFFKFARASAEESPVMFCSISIL